MTDVWDFYAAHTDGRTALTPVERGVLAICDLRQEVNSGGFEGYFCAWGGDSAPAAAIALTDALGSEWSALLVEAMALFGDEYPRDADARADLFDHGGLSGQLEALDQRFYDLEESGDADAALSEHLNTASAD